jgi:hypothetical protein
MVSQSLQVINVTGVRIVASLEGTTTVSKAGLNPSQFGFGHLSILQLLTVVSERLP